MSKRRVSPPPGQKIEKPTGSTPPQRHVTYERRPLSQAFLYALTAAVSVYLITRHIDVWAPYIPGGDFLISKDQGFRGKGGPTAKSTGYGHYDFGDGRKVRVPQLFLEPESPAQYWVNVMLGNGGPEPDLSGGMIPAVAPPFAMTRWTAQTRQNYVSMCPYNQTDTRIHGFIGTHQPAVWMGESGPAQVAAGLGKVVTDFDARGMEFNRADEYASANYYLNVLNGQDGSIETELSATSRVGHLRFTFHPIGDAAPHVVVDASRKTVITNNPKNVSYPNGEVTVDITQNEVYGWNDERQDHILVGDDLPAKDFKGYFVARFTEKFTDGGISRKGVVSKDRSGKGKELSAWVTFPKGTKTVEVRVGVSFISVGQARRNLDLEIPNGQALEETSRLTRGSWANKLDRLKINGATRDNRTVAFTGFAHTMVYPYEVSENAGTPAVPRWCYYSGYLNEVVEGESYSGYSIWDTFRAATAWQLFTAPERVPDMITSMLQDYEQGGWLPMWKNIVETNIMVGTHADSIIAQAIRAGIEGFNYLKAWDAVRKNAFTPPDRDTELKFFDREEHTPQEVRAGLTEYSKIGYVAADLHAESGSRTLDYAYDDHAAAFVARAVGQYQDAEELEERSKSYKALWNAKTGFMEAKNSDGSWAGPETGWTEGDHWAYSLNVMHDVPGLIELMGGDEKFIAFLDRHFAGGHNLHTNEPSHHIPYLYSFAKGGAHKAQEWVRSLGKSEYNHTDIGLSGNEDCGQMSAWYLFSLFGFYPVDPASATYVIGSPFFNGADLIIPDAMGGVGPRSNIRVRAPGASDGKRYIKSVKINGKPHNSIFIDHAQIATGADITFEMSDKPQKWPDV